jgi:quercetin dioxygenase-like cupin family protein
MICRHYLNGEKLDVANLNELIVLIDRSETALTEVALNIWRAGLVGPPHSHEAKEQLFYITSGEGSVKVGSASYSVRPGGLVYVPAGVVHQTIAGPAEPLCYLLVNVFLDVLKEGHASYADHVAQMKAIRKRQAETGQAGESAGAATSKKQGRHVPDALQIKKTIETPLPLLNRTETEGSDVLLVTRPQGATAVIEAHEQKEQTLFILSGQGRGRVGQDIAEVRAGDVVFVPENTPQATEATTQELRYLCFNTYVIEPKERHLSDHSAPAVSGVPSLDR